MATLPNNSSGSSAARKVLTTDPVHADIVNMSIEDLDQNIDAVNAESITTTAEVVAARSGEASLDARIDSVSGVAGAVSSEVTTARSGEANLSNRLALIASLQPREYQEIQADLARQAVPSGWLTEIVPIENISTNTKGSLRTYITWSNEIRCGDSDSMIVNGYKFNTPSDFIFTLSDPPSTGARVDLVFLEMWLKDITNPASGSSADRRLAGLLDDGTLPVNGNTYNYSGGGTAFDSTKASHRFQAQYRVRVVSGIDVLAYPDGVDHSAVVKAWTSHKRTSGDGVAESSMAYGQSPVDKGLYIAGDGNPVNGLGTSDGYVYAIPICAVHRRNTGDYNVVTNPNGAGITTLTTSQRPDGLFSHRIDLRDVIDLRHHVSFSGFDYQKLLAEGISDLLAGSLKTMFVPGDGIGIPSDVFGTTHVYVEQFGGTDVNNVNNRIIGNNSAITAMATNGQRRCWNDAAQTDTNHAKVSQTTTDLAPLYADYGVIRSAGTGTWDHSDVLTITAPTWTSVATANVYIYDELGNDVTAAFSIAGTTNAATCTIGSAFSSAFTADAATEQLTISSNSAWKTGARVQVSNSGGALPAGLAAATDYYVVVVNNTTVKLATSRANAIAGTVIDITGAGTGTHTITQQAPSFEAETNLHVVYNVAYPAGGGLVNVPSAPLRVEDNTGLLWHADGGVYNKNSYSSLGSWYDIVMWGNVSRNGAIIPTLSITATVANQITATLPTGYSCVGVSLLSNSTQGTQIENNVTNWSQTGQSVIVTVSSGIDVGHTAQVGLYVDRPFARFREETKAMLGTYVIKEVSVGTDGSGNGAAYLDYNEIGVAVSAMYAGKHNIRDASNNVVVGTLSVSAHKVTITGCSVISGTVKAAVVVAKTLKNNEFLRVWYECVPYMGIIKMHGTYGNLWISSESWPKLVYGHDKLLVSTIGTGGLASGYAAGHHFYGLISRLPMTANAADYHFVGTGILVASGVDHVGSTGESMSWLSIVNVGEDDFAGTRYGWYPLVRGVEMGVSGVAGAKRGTTSLENVDAVAYSTAINDPHYNAGFGLIKMASGRLFLLVVTCADSTNYYAVRIYGTGGFASSDYMYMPGRPLEK